MIDGFRTEQDACKQFDLSIAGDPRFSHTYPECRGIYQHRSPHEEEKSPRIDRVLIPSRELRNAGWLHGPIGVEIKKSETKVGPVIAQCIDYLRSSFELQPGLFAPIGIVFIFPCERITGDLESVMMQHRIGTCVPGRDGYLRFHFGKWTVSLEEPDRNFIPTRKVGSR